MESLLKQLESIEGYGCSKVTLVIPKGKTVESVIIMLEDELKHAESIKSLIQRDVCTHAIYNTISALVHYKSFPANGLVIWCDKYTVIQHLPPADEGYPGLYLCDNKFHTNFLN